MKHIMLDLETLGTRSNSVIAVIAAVYFDPETGETGKEFYRRINIQSCLDYGLEIDLKTLKWWFQQSFRARKEVFNQEDRIHIQPALRELYYFIKTTDDAILWGNSARFDLGILENAYYKIENGVPWKHWNERDVRTLSSFAPEIKENTIREGTHHNALDDCYHQIKYCSAIYQKIINPKS